MRACHGQQRTSKSRRQLLRKYQSQPFQRIPRRTILRELRREVIPVEHSLEHEDYGTPPRPRPVGATKRPGSESGQALIEFALSLSLLTLLFAGIVDYALIIQQAMQVNEAAAAGAAYGAMPGNQKDLTGMQTAATNAASGVSGFKATATALFTCTPGGASVSSSATCTGYGTPIEYVQVATSATVSPLLTWPGITPKALTGSASFRVPWTP